MSGKNILIVTIPEKGHINPMIGVAQHLVKTGNKVDFFSQADFSDQLRNAGLSCQVYTPGTSGVTGQPPHTSSGVSAPTPQPVTRGKDFVEKLKDKPWLRKWIRHLLLDVVPQQMEPLREIVHRVQPSVIVTDPMVYSAVLVAETEGIPWVGVSSSLNPVTPDDWNCELAETVKELGEARRKLFNDYGIERKFKVCDAISPWLNVVFTTEDYAPRVWSGNDFSFYAGPSRHVGARGDEQDFPWEKLRDDKPLVYMSLGSQIYYHPELFATVAKAIKPEEAQLVFSMNELSLTPFAESFPEHVLSVYYTPQTELLNRVSLMISHGGANSVMECLDHGCPIVLLPVCNDQFFQAEFVRRNGVGTVLDSTSPDVDEYRHCLLPLLDNNCPERKKAAEIGISYTSRDGALETAQLVIRLIEEQQPLIP